MLAAGDVGGCTTFPDSQYIPYNANYIDYIDSTCEWKCKELHTGRACADQCTNLAPLVCGPGMREELCSPPLDARCVACGQNGDEARQMGYSFDVGSAQNSKYDLMVGMGSFENSKIYPPVMRIRNAISTRLNSTNENWADILFIPQSYAPRWRGVGKIDLHYDVGKGARNSDVFAVLTAPHATLKGCDIQTQGFRYDKSIPNHINGWVYEFQYRQRNAIPGQDIQVHSAIQALGVAESQLLSDSFSLLSVDKWTRSQMLFDFSDMGTNRDDIVPWAAPADETCLRLKFDMLQHMEVLVDEIRVFPNLLRNSKFGSKRWWDKYTENGSVDQVEFWDNSTLTFVLTGGHRIQQTFYLSQRDSNWDGDASKVVAATFSMEVRGNGTLVVKYMFNSGNFEHEQYLIVVSIPDNGERVVAASWQRMEIPLTLHVRQPIGADTHKIFIYNQDSNPQTALEIDNVFLYVDDRSCPVLSCDDVNRVFVNGRCELCALPDGTACVAGSKQSGCEMGLVQMIPVCHACTSVVNASDTSEQAAGLFVQSQTHECTFKCSAGWWYARGILGESGPMCKKCTNANEILCRVGWYAAACMDESDAKCLPCDILDTYDNSVMYTGGVYNQSKNNEPARVQCSHACAPGQFQYGVRVSNGLPLCFACTESICGAKDTTGVSSFRLVDGLQYTSQCTASSDAQCKICESNDAAVIFTQNGEVVGEWCKYECAAGSLPCGTCTWEQSNARVSRNATQYSTYGNGEETVRPTGNIPFTQHLMVRLTGNAIVSTARVDTQVSIVITVTTANSAITWTPPDETGWVLRIFPVVPPAALSTMRQGDETVSIIDNAPIQKFDVTVEARDFIDTESFSTWNNANTNSDSKLFLTYEIIVLPLEPSIEPTDISGGVNISDFVVQYQDSVGGACCTPRDPVNPAPVDYQGLDRCTACQYADGISGNSTTPLPENAHWDTPNSCTWACNQQYELLPDGNGRTCQHCKEPDCTKGQYWDICDTCAECVSTVAHSTFSAKGTSRYDNTSCPIKCDTGFYYDTNGNECASCTSSDVLNCSYKPNGYFFEVECSDTYDGTCSDCLVCPPGYNASIPCGGVQDSVCIPCNRSAIYMPSTLPDDGVEWRLGITSVDYCVWGCEEDRTYNPVDNKCVLCHGIPCTIGYYRVPCTQENNFTGCARCVTPENAVVLSSGDDLLINSCIWECPDGMDYNESAYTCELQPIIETPNINTKAVAGPCDILIITTAPGVVAHICGWGASIDITRMGEMAVQLKAGNITCAQLCTVCPALPPGMMYKKQGSCKLICTTPLIWNGTHCSEITVDI